MTAEALMRELAQRELAYELIPHRRTMTAGEEAAAIGIPPAEVAKTLVLYTENGHVRAVLQGSERLDLHKIRLAVGDGQSTRLASETELASDYAMFELGAVPPFGGPADRTIVDRRLAERETVVIEAGSHDESVRMKTEDLLAITDAEVADISAD